MDLTQHLAILAFAAGGASAGCASNSASTRADSCPMSIAAYCAGKTQNCPLTWTDAQNVASWRCGPGTEGDVQLTTCQGVRIASVAYIDAGADLYYDTSGKLYRVEEFVNVNSHCAAGTGPSYRDDPNLVCEAPVELCTPPT
jgi:hypothetical protein